MAAEYARQSEFVQEERRKASGKLQPQQKRLREIMRGKNDGKDENKRI